MLYTPYGGGWDVGIPLIGPRPYAILYTPYGGEWDVGIPSIGPRPYPMLFDPCGVLIPRIPLIQIDIIQLAYPPQLILE